MMNLRPVEYKAGCKNSAGLSGDECGDVTLLLGAIVLIGMKYEL